MKEIEKLLVFYFYNDEEATFSSMLYYGVIENLPMVKTVKIYIRSRYSYVIMSILF